MKDRREVMAKPLGPTAARTRRSRRSRRQTSCYTGDPPQGGPADHGRRCIIDSMSRPAEPAAQRSVEARAVEAAHAALVRQRYVSAVDVLLGPEWLAPSHRAEERRGRGTGGFLVMETEGPRCLACSGLGHLVFVPRAAGLADAEAHSRPRGRQASGRAKDAETRKADRYGRPGGGRP